MSSGEIMENRRPDRQRNAADVTRDAQVARPSLLTWVLADQMAIPIAQEESGAAWSIALGPVRSGPFWLIATQLPERGVTSGGGTLCQTPQRSALSATS